MPLVAIILCILEKFFESYQLNYVLLLIVRCILISEIVQYDKYCISLNQ